MIAFPTNPPPQIDDTYTAAGKTWKWTGVVWQLQPRTVTTTDLSAGVNTSLGKADSALQASALTPYRTSAAQDTIDAGKATAAQGAKADSALQPASVDYAGPYNNGIGYGPNAVVLWNGNLYKKISNFSNPGYPPSGADWELFTPANGSFDAYKIAIQNSLDGKSDSGHGHALSDITISGASENQVATWNGTAWVPATPVVTNFQPNPEYAADSAANAQVSGFDGQPTAIFSRVNADYYTGNGIEYAISRDGQYNGGIAGSWLLEYTGENGGPIAISTTATTYPWQATWTNGVTVAKAALPRIVGAPLATNASEGTSVYAARADHAHPFPTAAQVGAAPAGNYATLDQTGKVYSSQLPSYVDDVVEYAMLSALQADTTARVSGKIYVVRDTGKIYRWSGSTYVEIVAAPGSSDAVTEGTTNKYFTTERQTALETAIAAKQTKTVYDTTAPAHAAGLEWVDTTTLRSYRSYNNQWVEIDRA